MDCRMGKLAGWLTVVAIALVGVPAASAQVFTGRIDVMIESAAGGHLTGATVELTGPVIRTEVTDARGRARFLNLPVGAYAVKAAIAGFNTYTNDSIEVDSGAATSLTVTLGATGTPEAAGVTAATPIVDVRRDTTTTSVSNAELQNIPSARDPWVVMQTVPTVYVDRVNVGGAGSGQQSSFNGKGANDKDNTWSLDGVPVTDMGATGSSAFFYDVDSFQEMAVTTGGADAALATGGVGLNMVLKTGMNTPVVNARLYFENQNLQSVNISPALAAALGNASGNGNRTDKYLDRGFDIGGPILKDQLWVWGTMAWTTIDLLTLGGNPDNTIFHNYSVKVDGNATPNIRGTFTFYENNNIRNGSGASLLRPAETTLDQNTPTRYYKGEGNFIVGRRLFASVKGAYIDGGFDLVPEGGLAKDYYFDAGLVAHGSFYESKSTRPQHYAGADANYFAGAHEIKFGGAWRSTPVDTQQIWPASHLVASWNSYPDMYVQVARDYRAVTDANYINAFATDTISLDRLTIVGGVRFDRQVSSLGAASVAGVTGIAVLPALSAPAVSGVFKWTNVTPRVGITYAVDASRKTVVRASYAMFASQLPGTEAAFVSPIQRSYAYYNAVDRNGDGVAQLSELLLNKGLQGFTGFDPNNPSALSSVNKVDPNVKAPITHELLVGFDRDLAASFGVSATLTYRRMVDLLWDPLTGVTASNYTQSGTLSGTLPEVGAYSVPLYALNAGSVPVGGGQTETNRQGYHQRYLGLEASATKRMSSRWMARFGFSTNDWREYFDNPSLSIVDPTKAPAPALSPSRAFAGPQINGGLVVRQTGGSGQSSVYMVAPRYQFAANGLYEGPWGFNLGANLVTRQGYAEPFYQSNVPTGDPLGLKTVLLVPNVDAFRLPSVTSLDGRIEKRLEFGPTHVAIDFDLFNLLNSGTVLGKQYDARATGATGFDQTLEIMNPRIARIGLRFTF